MEKGKSNVPVKIEWKQRFRKEFLALPVEDQKVVREEINRFQAGERVDLIRLNHMRWRLKMGVWRIFLTFSKGVVQLLYLERRTTTTYRKR